MEWYSSFISFLPSYYNAITDFSVLVWDQLLYDCWPNPLFYLKGVTICICCVGVGVAMSVSYIHPVSVSYPPRECIIYPPRECIIYPPRECIIYLPPPCRECLSTVLQSLEQHLGEIASTGEKLLSSNESVSQLDKQSEVLKEALSIPNHPLISMQDR